MKRISGHPNRSLSVQLAEMADFAEQNEIKPDRYGNGEFKVKFESEVAELFGYEQGLFVPSGVMAQMIACRIYADQSENKNIACHPTSHLELHEDLAYSHLHQLKMNKIGRSNELPTAEMVKDLDVSTIVLEIPMRHLGGEHISWQEFEKFKDHCRSTDTALHIDGARIWQSPEFYNKSLSEICKGTDSCYVSFYKDIGSTSGAMLLGGKDFIREAKVWLRRHGGDLFELWPLIIPAKMNFDRRFKNMKKYKDKADQVTQIINQFENLSVYPFPVQSNTFHLHFDCPKETVESARNRAQEQTGLDGCGGLWDGHPESPQRLRMEISIGDSAFEWSDQEIEKFYKCFNSFLVD